MAAATTAPLTTFAASRTRMPAAPPFPGNVWHAPLVPFALAVTAGIVADRYAAIPPLFSLVLATAGLLAWALAARSTRTGLPLVYLALSAAGLGAGYHHWQRDTYDPDDIRHYVKSEPNIVHVRGTLDEEPIISWQPRQDELRTIPQSSDPTLAVLRAERLRQGGDWLPVSGRAQLVVNVHLDGLHAGDEIEVVGHLVAPRPPANPGEFDHVAHLRDQHIQARLIVLKTPDAVQRIAENWHRSFGGWLAVLRGWGQRNLKDIGPMQGGLGMALLLGDGSTMTSADWEKYIRTGVIHVLAISGQHLVVLAFFLWWIVRLSGVRRRWGALGIAGFLLIYALLVGGRPPVMRSAVAVCVASGGLFLNRRSLVANAFALAWLTVATLNPTDLFNAGCQLSFLSVAVLIWGTSRWFVREPPAVADQWSPPNRWHWVRTLPNVFAPADPLERLIDESRPVWLRVLRRIGREIAVAYAVGLAIWLAVTPLVAYRYHMITLSGLLIGPPLVLLTSIALIAGFLLLACAAVCPFLVPLFAFPTRWSLAGCEFLVDFCDHSRWARWYVPDVPEWWLWLFYIVLLAVLTLEPLYRRRRWALAAAAVWLGVGLLTGAMRPTADELRCTFLAVGHGGCTVLETPDGRTLLYDAGAVTGPDVTRRIIAPYLWSRGIGRIDTVFLSHADLDHFNGLPALLERFAVGEIIRTPSFAEKEIPGVPFTLRAINDHHVPVRVITAGENFRVGDVEFDVMHPPAVGPEGNENARSLVLLLRHAGHCILLTGDLEKQELRDVLDKPAPRIDVLMAPHHGSRFANTPELARWAAPKYVVSCQESPRGPVRWTEPFVAKGAHCLLTAVEGAVTIRSTRGELSVETHLTRQRFVAR